MGVERDRNGSARHEIYKLWCVLYITMADVAHLASALLMGLFLIAVATGLGRSGRVPPPNTGTGSTDRRDSVVALVERTARKPLAWTAAFVLLTAGVTGGVLLYVGAGSVPTVSRRLLVAAAAGLVVAAFVLFLFSGTYITARSKGRSTARGVAEGIMALGLLFIVAIVATLVVG